MQWQDDGLVLGCRRTGESGTVLELMTRAHGRHAGFVHGGRSKRLAPVLQAGNTVEAVWRARLDEQLGHFTIEPKRMRAAALLGSPLALFGIGTLAAHLRLLPERDPHPELFEAATQLADGLSAAGWAADFVRFEILLLAELGFGLDLSACAATGAAGDLVYVSPKTGRAVGRAAGLPYARRLLALPAFLTAEAGRGEPDTAEIAAGLSLTGFFLARHVYEPRGQAAPPERDRLLARLRAPGDGPIVSGMFSSADLAAPDSMSENEA